MQHLTICLNLLLKNGLKFMISLVMQKIDTNQVNKQDLKHQCYNQIYVMTVMYICDDSDVTINVTDPKDNAYDKKLAFENNAQVIF